MLQERGHAVLTTHLIRDDVEAAESRLTDRQVFERDMRWLDASDLLIAEASGSSYGVGFEVGYVLGRAAQRGQRVLLLYREDRRPMLSRLITGNGHPACTTLAYRTSDEMPALVDRYLLAMAGRDRERTHG